MGNEANILIVDDEPTILTTFRMWLKKEGFRCYTADSVVMAMAVLKQMQIDLVVADIFMPGATGVDLLKWCLQTSRDIPFVFITGTLDASFVTQALNLGAKQLLAKPVSRNELISMVHHQIDCLYHDRKQQQDNEHAKSELSEMKQKYMDEVAEREILFMAVIDSLAQAVGARDTYTHNHNFSVADYATVVGEEMGLDNRQITILHIGGRLHDIGKIGVPESILHKKGKLTDDEYDVMKQHPLVGVKILQSLPHFSRIADIVLYHHERVDGKGYPKGLKGSEIPLLARITGVCDAWDAMTSDRVYRPKLTQEEAKRRLVNGAGTQFDISVVKTFLKTLNRKEA